MSIGSEPFAGTELLYTWARLQTKFFQETRDPSDKVVKRGMVINNVATEYAEPAIVNKQR